MFVFLFYVSSIIILLSGCLGIKRSVDKEEIFHGGIFSLLTLMLLQIVTMGIFTKIRVDVNCISIGVANYVIGGFMIYRCVKAKRYQKYQLVKTDLIANLIIIGVVLLLGMGQFGLKFDLFNYETVDIGTHLVRALEVINNKAVKEAYFAQAQIGLWRQCLEIFEGMYIYKIAIAFELMILYITGSTFWYLVRRWTTDIFSKCVGIIMTVLYLIGYPACGEIFGSQYLVCGIMLITALLVVFVEYMEKVKDRFSSYIIMMLICCGITVSYIQFVPVVFVALGLGIIYVEKNWKGIFKAGFGIFSLPVIMALFFTLDLMERASTPIRYLELEGYIYRDLYSDFLLIIPFAICGIIFSFKNKKFNLEAILFLGTVAWILIFLVGIFTKKISGYYYYKNYYLLWLCCWSMGAYAVMTFERKMRSYIWVFSLVWLCMFGLSYSKLDDYLVNNYLNINQSAKAGVMFSLYNFNLSKLTSEKSETRAAQELYLEAKRLKGDSEILPIIYSAGGLVYPYYGITEQLEFKEYEYDRLGMPAFWENIHKCKYLTIRYGNSYEQYKNILDSWEHVYENEVGFIAKVPEIGVLVDTIGLYAKEEDENGNPFRWGNKEGTITYINSGKTKITRQVSFEVSAVGNTKVEDEIIFEIEGEEQSWRFTEQSIITPNFTMELEPYSSKVIKWKTNIDRLETGWDLRDIYILFRNYDKEWDN